MTKFYDSYKAVFDAVKTVLVYVPAVPEVPAVPAHDEVPEVPAVPGVPAHGVLQLKRLLLGNSIRMVCCLKLLLMRILFRLLRSPWVKSLTFQCFSA